MIITDEVLLRISCTDVLPEEIGPLKDQLERELARSAELGLPGIGLAAIQIGINKNMAIVRIGSTSVDLVNCKIVQGYDQAFFDNEGCLSFPNRVERTYRYQEIVVDNNACYPHRFIATGLLAVCIQHELDHTKGILLSDHGVKEQRIRGWIPGQRVNTS